VIVPNSTADITFKTPLHQWNVCNGIQNCNCKCYSNGNSFAA